jgi:hypothetical protein
MIDKISGKVAYAKVEGTSVENTRGDNLGHPEDPSGQGITPPRGPREKQFLVAREVQLSASGANLRDLNDLGPLGRFLSHSLP